MRPIGAFNAALGGLNRQLEGFDRAAAQGVDYHAPLQTSPKLKALHERVRAITPHLETDRYWADEMAALQAEVLSGDLVRGL